MYLLGKHLEPVRKNLLNPCWLAGWLKALKRAIHVTTCKYCFGKLQYRPKVSYQSRLVSRETSVSSLETRASPRETRLSSHENH